MLLCTLAKQSSFQSQSTFDISIPQTHPLDCLQVDLNCKPNAKFAIHWSSFIWRYCFRVEDSKKWNPWTMPIHLLCIHPRSTNANQGTCMQRVKESAFRKCIQPFLWISLGLPGDRTKLPKWDRQGKAWFASCDSCTRNENQYFAKFMTYHCRLALVHVITYTHCKAREMVDWVRDVIDAQSRLRKFRNCEVYLLMKTKPASNSALLLGNKPE